VIDANPWLDRLKPSWTDGELDLAIAMPAGPLPDLSTLPVEQAVSELRSSLDQLVVPSRQMRDVLRRLHAYVRVGARQLFPDRQAFLARAYSEEPTVCSLPLICLTGLSGGGKTQILLAFHRTLAEPTTIDVPKHSRFRLISGLALTARSGNGLAQILKPVFPKGDRGRGDVFVRARNQIAKDGVLVITGDELQFVTRSKGAAKAANLLLQLCQLGPPFIFSTNFSLIHKLNNLPHEDRERLLTDVIIVIPDDAESPDWQALVSTELAVSAAFARLADQPGIAGDFHHYTFGIKRHVPRLMACSYGVAREDGRTEVRFSDLQRAYLSLPYASARQDIELLTAGEQGKLYKHKDLWCPLKDEGAAGISAAARRATSAREEALAQAAVEVSLNASERAGLKAARKASATSTKPERRKLPPATGDALRAGARAFGQKKQPGKAA
jgi:hypothetical protein